MAPNTLRSTQAGRDYNHFVSFDYVTEGEGEGDAVQLVSEIQGIAGSDLFTVHSHDRSFRVYREIHT